MLSNILNCVYQFFLSIGESPILYLPFIFLVVSLLFRIVWDLVRGRYN